MSSFQPGSVENKPYVDPTPLPDHIPKVQELGVTSAPLKSAAFFIGAYCKDYNGEFQQHCIVELAKRLYILEDFMLCKAENRDPAHCLKEGRRVTRCATDLWELYSLVLYLNLLTRVSMPLKDHKNEGKLLATIRGALELLRA